jgi:hypothetical protein
MNCYLNTNTISQACTILILINLVFKFFSHINSINKSLKFNANLLDLIYSITIKYITQILTTSSIPILASQLPQIFKTSLLTNSLQKIADNNLHLLELSFYTDSSVINLGFS